MNWSYIAGFIDGEGWIGYTNNYPRIVITQKNKIVLEKIKEFVGNGYIYGQNECYQLVWSDFPSVFNVLLHIRYLLIVKGDVACNMYFDIRERMAEKNITEVDIQDKFKELLVK
jgi:hypothetical protein